MNIEKITIEGKDYVPLKEFKHSSCMGCDFYQGACSINKLCKCIGSGLILKRDGTDKPVAGSYSTIRSYEDACLAMDVTPIYLPEKLNKSDRDLARVQLGIISMSFHRCEPNTVGLVYDEGICYMPVFNLFTWDEIQLQPEYVKQSALWVFEPKGGRKLLSSKSLYNIDMSTPEYANGMIPFNYEFLQNEREAARHFASRHFIQLWAIYLGFEFIESDFYIK